MVIICSGSGFYNDRIDNHYDGTYIGTVVQKDFNKTLQYRNLTFDITPNTTGNGIFHFYINNGIWKIANIKVKAVQEPGYNPRQTKILVPVAPDWDNDKISIRLEIFDFEGKLANQVFYIENIIMMNGRSEFIQGENNLLTGSMFVNTKLGNGLKISGAHSGIVQSSNYLGRNFATNQSVNGIPGFILWSGSFSLIETGSGISSSYDGVGIELQSAYNPLTRKKPASLRFSTTTGVLEITGSIKSTSATFESYAIADYIGSRVIEITTQNSLDFFKNYYSASVPFSYLNLSNTEASESAMYVKISKTSDFPISHIIIPKVDGYADNTIGGNIVLEFTDPNPPNSYESLFTDLLNYNNKSYSSYGFIANPQLSDLNESNAIRNFSGSYCYSGFKDTKIIAGNTYDFLLTGTKGSRYTFTKGTNGWSNMAADNYENFIVNYKSANILNLYGNRRNEFIGVDNLTLSYATTGSATTELWNGFNSLLLTGSFDGIDSYTYGTIGFTIQVPEFIINTSASLFHFFAYDSGITPRTITITDQSYSCAYQSMATETAVSITTNTLSDQVISIGSNTNMIYTNQHISLNNLISGMMIQYMCKIKYKNITNPRFLFSRCIFDRDSNPAKFRTIDQQPQPLPER